MPVGVYGPLPSPGAGGKAPAWCPCGQRDRTVFAPPPQGGKSRPSHVCFCVALSGSALPSALCLTIGGPAMQCVCVCVCVCVLCAMWDARRLCLRP